MDIAHPTTSMWICVPSCPREIIKDKWDLFRLEMREQRKYCLYDVDPNEYISNMMDYSSLVGPCPVLPIWPR